MKDTTPKPGAFRSFARLFTRNWGLKLVSLALAILIYYTLKSNGTNGNTRRLNRRMDSPVATVIEHVANTTPSAPAAPHKK